MERHFHVSQAFIPLGGEHAVVAVAPPSADRGSVPELEAIRAFLLEGSKGYVLHKGTWHSLDRFPLRYIVRLDRSSIAPGSRVLVGSDFEGRVKIFDRFAVIVEQIGADHFIFKHAIAAIRSSRPICN